ncbi:hypothetical protein [Cellulomonas sp. URHE0023]|uniref:hypothetical protein n=1 Tax=Cellulomonas sp. URHE0023 TaxID=1380354 RepID=UPI0004831A6D|nr:hypothetical protein [Cellulomonas sp. URHE0023]
MSARENPADGPETRSAAFLRSSHASRPRGWSTGETAALLGVLLYVLLPFAYVLLVLAATSSLGGAGSDSPETRRLGLIAVVLAALTIGCAIGAVVAGCVALLRGRRDSTLALIGIVLGLFPFLCLVVLALVPH